MTITQDEFDKATLQNLVEAAKTRPHIAALLDGVAQGVPLCFFLPMVDATTIDPTRARVVYIGADMPGFAFVPSQFDKPSIDHIFSNARSVLLQVAAPQKQHYALSVLTAELTSGLAVIIEVAEQHEITWFDYIKNTAKKACVMWVTSRGNGHPQ